MSDISHAARDFMEKLDRLSSKVVVLDALLFALRDVGVERACLTFFPQATRSFSEAVLVENLPEGWIDTYEERGFSSVDESLIVGSRAVKPFIWGDVQRLNESPKAREFLEGTVDRKIDRGLVVPVPTPQGTVGITWFGGEKLDLDLRHQPFIHIMGLYAFERIRLLNEARAPTPVQLSAREREILHWVARGKSAWAIGEILNIGHRTVETHIQAAIKKLGAGNRTHAVALAVRDKLITL